MNGIRIIGDEKTGESAGRTMTIFFTTLTTPIGPFTVSVDEDGALVSAVFTAAPPDEPAMTAVRNAERCSKASRQIREYFAGKRKQFDIDCRVISATLFQVKVWNAISAIPYGRTRSYKEIAETIGNPNASRAVGNAAGANPFPVFVPCHRLLAHGGKIGGYSAGLDIKVFLLGHEKRSDE